ncbi:Retrovirus-related Pol polyprotein LINE-1, partial [Heterocephalus glaber]
HCWWECKMVQQMWQSVWRFLKKLNLGVPFDPAIPLLDRIVFAILGLFWFQMNFGIVFSNSVRYAVGILIKIALNL